MKPATRSRARCTRTTVEEAAARRIRFWRRRIERVRALPAGQRPHCGRHSHLKMNLESYPSSAGTLDALGEAYEKDRNPALAISTYEKALRLDPKLAHASDALNRMKN